MRLAHVNSETGYGGGEAQVFLLLQGLIHAGVDCVLFCPPGSASEARAARLGIETHPVRMRNDLDVVAALRLARGFRSWGADLVHLHTGRATWLGGWGAQVAGVPAMTTRRMDRPLRTAKSRVTYTRLTRRVVAISPAVQTWLRVAGVPEERIELISSAVDVASLVPRRSRDEVRREMGAEPEEVVVLAVGALQPGKGHGVLLESLARMEAPPTLWIAGEGESREALEQRSGPGIKLVGYRSDIPDLLGACDVFAMPSLHEGLGVAALEAMALGRPVVASNVGGLAHAVAAGRTGLLVPPGDAEALADALRRLSEDPKLRAQFGQAGAQRVRKHFLASKMVDSYIALYQAVLDGRPLSRRPD